MPRQTLGLLGVHARRDEVGNVAVSPAVEVEYSLAGACGDTRSGQVGAGSLEDALPPCAGPHRAAMRLGVDVVTQPFGHALQDGLLDFLPILGLACPEPDCSRRGIELEVFGIEGRQL
ncbi:MAG: hypothetical protein U0796_14965 [Gemmatales bacterium]